MIHAVKPDIQYGTSVYVPVVFERFGGPELWRGPIQLSPLEADRMGNIARTVFERIKAISPIAFAEFCRESKISERDFLTELRSGSPGAA